uniref:Homeobox domain-containing protein n=1 Tax=Globodera pallida TaxID=36090 RepID=A0A183C0A0_GLOPA
MGNQELYLLNNLDLLFTIYKAKDPFLMQTLLGNDTNKYRLAVHDVKIYAKMIEPRVYADWQRELLVAAYEAHGRYLSMPHARQLALQTRLTTKQVTKWFCNRRLRRR